MPKTNPRYFFTIDWEDRGTMLPYGHESMVEPIMDSIDLDTSLSLFDIHNPVGLRGNFEVDDPDLLLDPAVHAPNTPDRIRLESPHRFWHYRINSDPADFSPRLTGYLIVVRRPDAQTARFKLLPVDFVRLRAERPVPPFNTYRIPVVPTITRSPASASVALRGVVNAEQTELNVIAALTNSAYSTFSPLQLADGMPIYFRINNSELRQGVLAAGIANIRIAVTAGTTVVVEADVQESFQTKGVATFTIAAEEIDEDVDEGTDTETDDTSDVTGGDTVTQPDTEDPDPEDPDPVDPIADPDPVDPTPEPDPVPAIVSLDGDVLSLIHI